MQEYGANHCIDSTDKHFWCLILVDIVNSEAETQRWSEEAAPWEHCCHDTTPSALHSGHYQAHTGQSVKVATHYSHVSVRRPSHHHDSQHCKRARPCPWRPAFHTNEEPLGECIYLQLCILALRQQRECNVCISMCLFFLRFTMSHLSSGLIRLKGSIFLTGGGECIICRTLFLLGKQEIS